MDMDITWIQQIQDYFGRVIGSPVLSSIIMAIVLACITLIAARVCVNMIRKYLQHQESSLAESSFYVTVVRIVVWGLGACIILDTCFHVNMSAIIAALGVGGIAISLGFQDTLSNLFGGAAITLTKMVKPGDNIQVSGYSNVYGVVQDIQWRQTTIANDENTIVVPNSVLSKNPVVHLLPEQELEIPILLASVDDVDGTTRDMIKAAKQSCRGIANVIGDPQVFYNGINGDGVTGAIIVQIDNPDKEDVATDAIVRAIAPFAKKGTQAETLPHSHELLELAAQDVHHDASGILAKVSATVPDTIAGTIVNPAPATSAISAAAPASAPDADKSATPTTQDASAAPASTPAATPSDAIPAAPTGTAPADASTSAAPNTDATPKDSPAPATPSPKDKDKS